MPDEITNELIYEVLKNVQTSIARLETGMQELKHGQINIRDDIHAVRGDVLRHDKALASLEIDMERIKHRLDMVDN